ncbi:AbiTii (plasmid) [Caballeronia sp. SBC1]|uniref:AbiTii domain-containing protein n=1 Tax=unclassified Caballeronia TaxID=2646786 RepID=UPI0013E1D74A|nr:MULTISPECIES: hypothetical protein [unclassified Caballeronia]QIE29510.1 AbiTii [Caballeronia sp. SBC2]QIN67769.1 AbiTii [Caballeronia sp. SBC1]
MRLITEIIDLLSSESANLADALFKAKVLAYRMGQPELKAWIDSELNGYPDGADLPPYRVLAITCVANVTDGYTHPVIHISYPKASCAEERVYFQ